MQFIKKRWSFLYVMLVCLTVLSPHVSAENSQRTFFVVDNLSCGFCLKKINKKLKTLDGYIGMLANVNKKLIAIDHTAFLEKSDIRVALASVGYPARPASESEVDYKKAVTAETPGWRSPEDGFFTRVLKKIGR